MRTEGPPIRLTPYGPTRSRTNRLALGPAGSFAITCCTTPSSLKMVWVTPMVCQSFGARVSLHSTTIGVPAFTAATLRGKVYSRFVPFLTTATGEALGEFGVRFNTHSTMTRHEKIACRTARNRPRTHNPAISHPGHTGQIITSRFKKRPRGEPNAHALIAVFADAGQESNSETRKRIISADKNVSIILNQKLTGAAGASCNPGDHAIVTEGCIRSPECVETKNGNCGGSAIVGESGHDNVRALHGHESPSEN